ncbi:exodeoxyribonuclease VII large subunit [Limnochorda pilosa]|uniref:Exodeoxyribonuclease 7 large subunit n=1 Tax=Limnochorda pilosa TaxID=1555112 RepID=A0A0K2SMR6_LIMPI|nr:exodeoxyribonuclease VII large subunit [Limnochorda pilosa]
MSQLTRVVKALLEGEPGLRRVAVRGELSNVTLHTSGHLYFTLKDVQASLRCVMFRGQAQHLRFRPREGQDALALGSIGVYERNGQYQLYVDELVPAGEGQLYAEFQRLKEKLEREGLFDPTRKRRLPRLPRRVGVVTSPAGAALRDVVTVLRRRFPAASILLSPALVQGAEAPDSLVRALGLLAAHGDVDVIIIGRGGGSLEDLWAFNDERVVRAIAASPVPIVSAVGHETDVTLADFAADVRAPTPSAAAELVAPDARELASQAARLERRLTQAVSQGLRARRERLRLLARSRVLSQPLRPLQESRQRLDELTARLEAAFGRGVTDRRSALAHLAARLETLSPLGTLARGYAVATTPEGRVVHQVGEAPVGSRLLVRVSDGSLGCRVEVQHPLPQGAEPPGRGREERARFRAPEEDRSGSARRSGGAARG